MPLPPSHLANLAVLGALVTSIFATNYVVDPFNANRAVDLDFNKRDVTSKLSRWDWNVAEYTADPTPVILLGDSRMGNVDAERVEEYLGLRTYNFAYGGGTVADMISTFWHASELTELKHVVMGFNLNILNQSKSYDAAGQAFELLDDPLRYYFSPFITGATARTLWFNLGQGGAYSEKPPMDPEKFWQFKLNYGHQVYATYTYPDKMLARLREVVDHCHSHGIALTFLTFPTHTDLQDLVVEYQLVDARDRTRQALADMVPLWDYDVPNRVTRDPANFKDPFHFTEEAGEHLVDEIFGGKEWLGIKPKQSFPGR